jgi:hypothetical protein
MSIGHLKINLIVFSKDRACQLDLLLRSINELGWRDSFYVKIIYKASDDEYTRAYKLCALEHSWAKFELEYGPEAYKPGYENTAGLQNELNRAMLTKRKIDFQCLSTDDMVFYRHSTGDLINIIKDLPDNGVFSLRLGLNTTIQDYHIQSRQPALHKYVRENNVLKWRPADYNAYANYGYPLAVDCHVLRTDKMWDLCNRFKWKTTNELEGKWQTFSHEINELWSYSNSVAVNIPANSISGVTRAGEVHGYSTKVLNDEYLAGKRIDLNAICGEAIVGCHQEIELKLI